MGTIVAVLFIASLIVPVLAVVLGGLSLAWPTAKARSEPVAASRHAA